MSLKALINKEYLLKKIPGKGGWTYAEIPEIAQNKNNPFGWVKVKGSIDDFEIKQYKLMPMGEGKLFFPVKAAIRKAIGKEEGDKVHIILYSDESLLKIPDEIKECFENEPKSSLNTFYNFTEGEQKSYLDWIYNAKTDATKIKRILVMMERLKKGLNFYDKEEDAS
jgi:hypothetical protein